MFARRSQSATRTSRAKESITFAAYFALLPSRLWLRQSLSARSDHHSSMLHKLLTRLCWFCFPSYASVASTVDRPFLLLLAIRCCGLASLATTYVASYNRITCKHYRDLNRQIVWRRRRNLRRAVEKHFKNEWRFRTRPTNYAAKVSVRESHTNDRGYCACSIEGRWNSCSVVSENLKDGEDIVHSTSETRMMSSIHAFRWKRTRSDGECLEILRLDRLTTNLCKLSKEA